MKSSNRNKKNIFIFVCILSLYIIGCRPEPIIPPGPLATGPSASDSPRVSLPSDSQKIVIQAQVPKIIYSNVFQVYLNASGMTAVNGKRVLFFNWSCTEFPAGAIKPDISSANESLAWILKPVIGKYKFQLKVQDNLGNVADTIYTMDVLEDTIAGKKPIVKAGPDQQIIAPVSMVNLDATETYKVNATGRDLFFHWTIIEKPAGNSLLGSSNRSLPIFTLYNLGEGVFKIQLEVKNEYGLSAYDTIEVKILPDPLKDIILVFEDEQWNDFEFSLGGVVVGIEIKDPVLFINRHPANMEVRIWDEDIKSWSDLNKFSWVVSNGTLFIEYPWPGNDDDYYKMIGVKARVQVKIL